MKIDMQKIVSVGDAVKECIPSLEAMAAKTKIFIDDIKEQLSQVDPEQCPDHEDVTLEIDMEKTIGFSWKNQALSVRYKVCPKCDDAMNAAFVNEKLTKLGIPDKVKHATLENFKWTTESQKKALIKVTRQSTLGGFILLRGTPGTGKSHLAAAVLKSATGLFVTEADLIAELRQTYSDNSGQDEMVEKYRHAKILVLDELTVDVVGKDIPALLYRILADRYDKGKLTVITSNEKLDDMLAILGARLADRIRENNVCVTCEWESFRKPTK